MALTNKQVVEKEQGRIVPCSYCDVWTFKNKIVHLRSFLIKTKA